MSDELPVSTYDEVPYESQPFHYSHPDMLATAAMLAGLTPVPVTRCRVLELGCAAGGNLLPMAQTLPDSRFVGIDLSARQIADGQAMIAAAGLRNVELKAMSILDVGPELGLFDYIICHGVYSWVPPEVQDKILDICKKNLSPNGVAYVSYNTYPGWHLREMIREMMLYHVRGFPDPRERIAQSRALVDLLVSASVGTESAYTRALKEEVQLLSTSGDHYIFHEHLEVVNQPIYFHEFAGRAADKGLQYLGEAHPDTNAARIPPDVKQKLAPLAGDVIRTQQYLDFMSSRRFRWTLLCHAGPSLRQVPDLDAMGHFQVLGFLGPEKPSPDVHSSAAVAFVALNGLRLTTADPLAKTALAVLSELRPIAIQFDALCQQVQKRLKGTPEPMSQDDRRRLAWELLHCRQTGAVELHTYLPPLLLQISRCPRVTALARLQASSQPRVTNLRHRVIAFPPLERLVLTQLDGAHDRSALLAWLAEIVRKDVLKVHAKDGSQPSPEAVPGILEQSLGPAIQRIALNAMLVE